jgi:hypothetical protein
MLPGRATEGYTNSSARGVQAIRPQSKGAPDYIAGVIIRGGKAGPEHRSILLGRRVGTVPMAPTERAKAAIEKVRVYRREIAEGYEEVKKDAPAWQKSLDDVVSALKEAERKCRWEADHLREAHKISEGFNAMARTLAAERAPVGAEGAAIVAKEFEAMSRLTHQLVELAETLVATRRSVEALLTESRDSIVRATEAMLRWLDAVTAVSEADQ